MECRSLPPPSMALAGRVHFRESSDVGYSAAYPKLVQQNDRCVDVL